MRNLLTPLINLVFPPRETGKIVQDTSVNQIASTYSPGTFQSYIYLAKYKEDMIKAAITENKFHQHQHAGNLLGSLLSQWTKHQIMPTLYIPIPLGPDRLKSRGYNQVEKILRTVNPSIEINTDSLIRKTDTLPQSKLDRESRLNNMKGAFTFNINGTDLTKYSQIIIIDDVVTTGATFKSAQTALEPYLPADVTLRCLALAH